MLILAAVLIGLVITALMVIAWCMIFNRAGYSWALGLLVLVPIANVIIVLVLAFSTWPIQREVEQLRAIAGRVPSPAAPPGTQAL